tara:strand:+ start:1001 stop:2698 length:1698 start_codon:yes stop_codon:yes gene_type:complete
MINRYFLIIFLILKVSLSFAQTSEGEIEDAQIIINKNSKIILKKVDKKIEKINLEDNLFKKKKIVFDSLDYKSINVNQKIDKFKKVDNLKLFTKKNTTITIMGGNYGRIYLNTNPYLINKENILLGSEIFVDFNNKGSKLGDLSKRTLSDISLDFDYKINSNNKINTYLNLLTYNSAYYGIPSISSSYDLYRDDIVISKRKLNYDLDWNSSFGNFYSMIKFKAHNFNDLLYDEGSYSIAGSINTDIGKSIISLNPKINFYNLDNNVPSNESVSKPVNNLKLNKVNLNNFVIPISFNYTSDNFMILLSGNYTRYLRNFKEKKVIDGLYPSFKLKYKFNILSFLLSGSKGLFHYNYSDELNLNPFIYDNYISSQFDISEDKYRVDSEVDIKISNSTNLSIIYQIRNIKGSLDYVLSKDNNILNGLPIYLYSISLKKEQESIQSFSLILNSLYSKNLSSSINFIYNKYAEQELFMPIYNLDIVNSYESNNLSISLGAEMKLKTYGIYLNTETFKMNEYINLYLNSSLKISDSLNFEFNVNNILNRYNEMFFMYPQLGINLLTGIKWKF